VAGSCEHSNEPWVAIKGGGFSDQRNDSWTLFHGVSQLTNFRLLLNCSENVHMLLQLPNIE
jgi:hypothetical protein